MTHITNRDREASEERLLRLAMDVSDGREVDWDSEKQSYPDLQETLKHGQVVASIANVCGLPRISSKSTVTVHATHDQAPPETEHPKTWGHLRDLEFIDSGKFGDVYRAHDTRLEIDVALKLLKEGHAIDCPGFLNEAQQLARVHNDHVVTVHGADEHDGRIGLWTDFLVGQTLEEQLKEKGTMSPCEAISTGLDMCRALAAVHKAGLIHNDVKTNNIMRLEENGRNVLMDFGCVGEQSSGQTSEASFAGTPVYMAPERILFKEPATRAADIYALGVVLYRLVTNEYPVDGANFGEVVSKHRRRQLARLIDRRPDLDARLIEVVERALEHDPQDRFQTIGEMESALRGVFVPPLEPKP